MSTKNFVKWFTYGSKMNFSSKNIGIYYSVNQRSLVQSRQARFHVFYRFYSGWILPVETEKRCQLFIRYSWQSLRHIFGSYCNDHFSELIKVFSFALQRYLGSSQYISWGKFVRFGLQPRCWSPYLLFHSATLDSWHYAGIGASKTSSRS